MRRRSAVTLVAALGSLFFAVSAAADEVPDDQACQQVRPDRDYDPAPRDIDAASSIAGPLRLAEAHRIATGKGVGVAVVDTGLDPGASERLEVRPGAAVPGVKNKVYDGHGTQVAGLIAGRSDDVIGVAPGAHVVPIRVADGGRSIVESYGEDESLTGVQADNIAAGIRLAIDRAGSDNIRVINVSLSVEGSTKALTRALAAADRAGILVVAAAGNRPQPEVVSGEQPKDEFAFEPGEDRIPWPARGDHVLAVTALADDLSLDPAAVRTGPPVDVSAPVIGATTLGPEGTTCRVADLATSWAAAEVSGLAALVFEAFPESTPAQVTARIKATARGAVRGSALDGAGMVQPVAALTADLDVDDSGNLVTPSTVVDPAPELTAPRAEPDELAAARGSLRWWALGAGGALVLALLLRPLLARRQ